MLAIGCTRTRYRLAADRDSHCILEEKAAYARLNIPSGYSVTPDPRSRFYDPTNPDCPQLPIQQPTLYGYQIPELVTRQATPQLYNAVPSNTLPTFPPAPTPPGTETSTPTPPLPMQFQDPNSAAPTTDPATTEFVPSQPLPLVIPIEQPVFPASFLVQPARETIDLPKVEDAPPASEPPANTKPTTSSLITTSVMKKVIVPPSFWNVVPETCIARMLEFASLRAERALSFPEVQEVSLIPNVQRLSLENLMELATINSREYQTRKEILFRAALAVTRQRYQYELNPTPFGNGSAANYRHLRDGGETVNTLAIPSAVGVQKTLASGGQFLARFANSVVLTFNGPSGFATDIGSEMVFDFQQTLFQRDVRFENLTQSERDVVYATRDYVRFRKQLFRDISNQYYNLLLNYRGIEINAQDYFTNLRGFLQSQAEYRTAEKIPRIQVDQFEQNVLRARSNLVNNCFTLEAALDQLKFRIGIPPELPIFLDLSELESISMRDELSVARQMISRARLEVVNSRGAPSLDATSLANAAEVLADRMMNILQIQQRMQTSESGANLSNLAEPSTTELENNDLISQAFRELDARRQMLQLLGARLQVDILRAELDAQLKTDLPVPPLRVLIRAIEFSLAELQVIDMAIDSQLRTPDKQVKQTTPSVSIALQRETLSVKLEKLTAFLERISTSVALDATLEAAKDFEKIPERMTESIEVAREIEKLAKEATRNLLPVDRKDVEMKVRETVDLTIDLSDRLIANGPTGWEEINIDGNEAMLTALVQRLDLMNQRGVLADAWRQIKLAGDDLRSIVDLRATQVMRTNSSDNKPFDFTFDDSETRLSVALDTPLNRRVQRNNFRVALINYNVGLRNLIAAEDNIKLDVREDLRQLQLDRNQYTIAVASAALAFERVISTRLRLQLAVQNVAARDFLESQQAYTNALSSIARQHVNYIIDRTELFFDLEGFNVEPLGHWGGVTQDYGPQVNTDFPATNPHPYDRLPSRVWYSPTIRQMESIPPGESTIAQPQTFQR